MKKKPLHEAMYGKSENSTKSTLNEAMYDADTNLGQMYNDIKPQQEKPKSHILDRNRGTRMTTARTRRHVTINIGDDRVTLPSPQLIYDLELKISKLERDCSSLSNHIRTVINENNSLKRDIDRLDRELKNKIDYPS